MTRTAVRTSSGIALLLITLTAAPSRVIAQATLAPVINPTTLVRLGTVDERYQSYNIEMLEVTGGKFWKPYNTTTQTATQPAEPNSNQPLGMDPNLYAYRPPKDLGNVRLRRLAAALGPAYVRVSGTWANSTYFPPSDDAPTTPPAGFNGVLTHQQWKGVIDFSHATNAEIVTSFATSVGTRDASGLWTPDDAKRFLDYTTSAGGRIAAAEFMNEPTFAGVGGAPKGYAGKDFGQDFHVWLPFIRKAAPGMIVLGPGSVGESDNKSQELGAGFPGFINSNDLLTAAGPGVDAFSYHFYGTASKRCGQMGMALATPGTALSEEWLSRTDAALSFYRKLRDQYEPGKPLWLTETGETACGGNPWASTYIDTFRYLDQLGRLAKAGVKVVIHNTLAASDYALLDENTFAPRPNYWAALLWRRLMGATVLDSGIPLQQGLHVYAHCLRDKPGGVALLVIQNDPTASHTLSLPRASERYTLSAAELESRTVMLNGTELKLTGNDELPQFKSVHTAAGSITFAPATISFLAIPTAGNSTCH